MAGSGSVVTSAGLVFAATMASFVFSDLRAIGQVGTTIALGLLFDTLIVRAFMTPPLQGFSGAGSGGPNVCAPVPPARCCGLTGPAPRYVNCCCGRTTTSRPPRYRPGPHNDTDVEKRIVDRSG
jgi:RND superfamily putative drug exporter